MPTLTQSLSPKGWNILIAKFFCYTRVISPLKASEVNFSGGIGDPQRETGVIGKRMRVLKKLNNVKEISSHNKHIQF